MHGVISPVDLAGIQLFGAVLLSWWQVIIEGKFNVFSLQLLMDPVVSALIIAVVIVHPLVVDSRTFNKPNANQQTPDHFTKIAGQKLSLLS